MDLSLPKRIRQWSMDQANPNIPNQGQRPTVIVFGPNILKQGRKRPIDQPIPSTSSQVPDPIGQVGPNTFDKDQQQPADKTSSSIPDQTQQHPIDATDLNIPNKDQQQPIDQPSPSTSKQSRKRPIGDSSPSGAPKRDRKQPIDESSSSTSSQIQQQPMEQGEFANTVTNQVTRLSEKYQKTLDDLKQGLVVSKETRKEKWQAYHECIALGSEKWSALARGEEIFDSRYDPKLETQLEEEYIMARRKVYSARRKLKDFMKRRGLEFKEPDSDSD
ncbi:hypothetical protein BDEG_28397 [Batrachochytrium dendrobatidis JEL423]|uniref:Uncharacterized protein n=1 Tax=Batrachochytrium dendrobatidis (strain JEL423) TaxID=403673 RepID=A0A177WZX5_BATDL|nr:hypothetical protein BDEG_28397 [Batrachochytrium dendrobatidis JEL423]